MTTWYRTDEVEQFVDALEMAADSVRGAGADPRQWRWAILAMHSAFQGVLVLALRGTDRLSILPDKLAQKWLHAYRSNTQPPRERMDTFPNLYKKAKSSKMKQFGHSQTLQSTPQQDDSVRRLNSLRNQFIHFNLGGWSVELDGHPRICLDCCELMLFLGWKCGNVYWNDSCLEQRATKALSVLDAELTSLDKQFAVARGNAPS